MKAILTSLLPTGAALLIALLAGGCSTMAIPKYTGGPGKGAQTQEALGLKVTADNFNDKQRAETYFRTNPHNDGIMIVYLRAENQSPDATWLVNEESMWLVDAAGTALMNAHDQKVEGDYGAADAVGIAGAAAISLPMMFAASKLGSDAMVEQKNFVDREWRNQTLSPGQNAEGFIYFKVGKAANLSQGVSLRLACLNTRNQQTNTITITIPIADETR